MKTIHRGLLTAVLAASALFMASSTAPALDRYADNELTGTLAKVDTRNRLFKLDRGPDHKVKYFKYDSKTKFMDGSNQIKIQDLKIGQPLKVQYVNVKAKDEKEKSRAIKVTVLAPSEGRRSETR